MAKSRSIPTDLLCDPDYMELDSDTQVILLMLVLTADDEGRGRAHTGMFARHFNKPAERIEHALELLAELDLVLCYIAGRHRYYQLLRWGEWQTLSKPTPSRFPNPPHSECPPFSNAPWETQASPGLSWVEGEEGKGEENGREQNQEEKEEAEEEGNLPVGITRFPPPAQSTQRLESVKQPSSPPPGGNVLRSSEASHASGTPVQQVARILRLPVTEALTHVVTEYTTFGSLALLSEAHAACAWIEDRTRNRSHKPMSVAFFHRWLKREQEMQTQRLTAQALPAYQQEGEERRLPSLMHLADEDRRLQEAIQAKEVQH